MKSYRHRDADLCGTLARVACMATIPEDRIRDKYTNHCRRMVTSSPAVKTLPAGLLPCKLKK